MVGQYTKEEFYSQADAWEKVLKMDTTLPEYEGNLIFFGAGVAFSVAKTLAWTARKVLGRPAFAVASQDMVLHKDVIPTLNAWLYVAISRTGTVSDNIAAIKAIKATDPNSRIFAIIGEDTQDVGKLSDESVTLDIPEMSVATTKTISSITLAGQAMMTRTAAPEIHESLSKLPGLLRSITPQYEEVCNKIAAADFGQLVFLGTGPHLGMAEASALAVLEMSVERCIAHQSLVFMHGHCVTTNHYPTLVVAYVSNAGSSEELKALDSLNKEKTTLVCIGDSVDEKVSKYAINTNAGLSDTARSVLYLPFGQLLGVTRSIARGYDPDCPPNLEKVF